MISIHAPREGCDVHIFRHRGCPVISIHAPREGCDLSVSNSPMRKSYFNPRTPRGVRHGETCQRTRAGCYFNPRTPRGVRQRLWVWLHPPPPISIHAPREGCDRLSGHVCGRVLVFQSTHPARGATTVRLNLDADCYISIHAPREGCDKSKNYCMVVRTISIHAPREGCDLVIDSPLLLTLLYFNPRTPRGVRPAIRSSFFLYQLISIHAPREGCDKVFVCAPFHLLIFQSTHPARGATRRYC